MMTEETTSLRRDLAQTRITLYRAQQELLRRMIEDEQRALAALEAPDECRTASPS